MCSASCGGGSRTRTIFCTEENGNETTKVNKNWDKDNLNTRNSFILNPRVFASISFVSFHEKHTMASVLQTNLRRSETERKRHQAKERSIRFYFHCIIPNRVTGILSGFSGKLNVLRA